MGMNGGPPKEYSRANRPSPPPPPPRSKAQNPSPSSPEQPKPEKEKEFDWKKLRQMSWDKVTKELDKCDMLCANFHRERHYEIFSLNNK